MNVNKITLRNITVLLGIITVMLAAAPLSPALPGMAEAFQNLPNAEFLVQLTLTIPALVIAVSAPFVGLLLDRIGRKPVIVVSLILFGVAGTSSYFAGSLTAIMIGRALLGLSVAGTMTGFTTLLTDYFSGQKLIKYMGYQGAVLGLGGVFFLILSGYLADVGWRFPFLIYLFGFLLLPGVIFTVNEPEQKNSREDQNNPEAPESFPTRKLLPIYIFAILGVLVLFTIPIQVPFYIAAELGVSNSQIGLALSMQTLSSVLAALLYQRLKARLSFQAILALVFVVLGINHAVIAFTSTYGLLVIGLLIGGLGLGLLPPNFNVWITSVTPVSMRGRALGGFTTALFLGQFLTPIVTQPLVNRFGLVGASGLFGIAAVFAILLAIVIAGRGFKRW